MTQYVSTAQMESLGVQYVTSYLVNTNDQQALLDHLAEADDKGLTVFTSSLKNDLDKTFKAVDIFILIMIGFSLGMGFIILAIMSQNALMEQQRPISVMRSIGFTIMNVSNLWTLQSLAQFVLSSLFAIPAAVLLSSILFSMSSSVAQIYPFIFDWRVIAAAAGFIVLVIVSSHMLAMFSIKRWNLADNTRSRE